ncbi:uncharacterized protein LOC109790579 [Cajanus cajan]|uniref:uncharacterized protein LOC109790579 n=1 Tax=Cajanus cajan TaxID=3821 RepID=UPI00098D9F5D|nr:uncharacterized protein LOC109790579 [Cajanus cajan]
MSPWPFAKWGMDILGPFPPAKGQLKFFPVAIDYFTKWIEACSLAKITAENSFEDFLRELRIKHLPTSVEHPQTNGQAKAANKVILRELKKRLGSAKGQWVDELPNILWVYHCTPQSITQETPYRLTYGADAMISIEVDETSHRRHTFDSEQNA